MFKKKIITFKSKNNFERDSVCESWLQISDTVPDIWL